MRLATALSIIMLAVSLIIMTACDADDQARATSVPLPTETAAAAATPRSTVVMPSGGSPLLSSAEGLDRAPEQGEEPLHSGWEKVTDRNVDLFNSVL